MHSDLRTTLASAKTFASGVLASDTINLGQPTNAMGFEPLYVVVSVAATLTAARWLIIRLLSSTDSALISNIRCHAQWGDALLSPTDAGHPTTSAMFPAGANRSVSDSVVAVIAVPPGYEYRQFLGVGVFAISAAGTIDTGMSGALNIELTDQPPTRFVVPDAITMTTTY